MYVNVVVGSTGCPVTRMQWLSPRLWPPGTIGLLSRTCA
jgi:hypothetical protein